MTEYTLLYLFLAATLLLAGACSSRLSAKINLPVLIAFLFVGMIAGSDKLGLIQFDNPRITNFAGTAALTFILFSGGYETSWKSVKGVLFRGGLLSSLGVLLTALLLGVFTAWILHIPLIWGLLLGAIVSSTDASAVFSVLRSKSVSLSGKVQPLLEFESGSNDPMAALLTIVITDLILYPETSLWQAAASFPVRMGLGILTGYLCGRAGSWLFNRINLDYTGLYYVLGFGIVLATYSGTELTNGNGFLAVYTCGITMGNSKFICQHGLGRFHSAMAWLMQVILFCMLGVVVKPEVLILPDNIFPWLAIALFLMFAARPAAVFLCLLFSKYSFREKLFISWVGLRGGAPIVLATFPLFQLWEQGGYLPETIFHIVFFIVLVSMILQGWSIMPIARFLKLDRPLKVRPRIPLEFENTGNLDGEMREWEIVDPQLQGKRLAELGLPPGALILLIRRGHSFVVPHGRTKLELNDGLMILGDPKILDDAGKILGEPVEGN